MHDRPLHAWREHTGGTAWPTVVLAALILVTWSGAVLGHAVGVVPTAAAILVATLTAYVSFTPLHEATHGNVGGRARPWLDAVVGWLSAVPLLAPYPAFKALHLRHHARTNHPEQDPDMWVSGTGWRLVGRCLTYMPHLYRVFLGPLAQSSSSAARTRPVAIAFIAVLAPILGGLALAGWATTVALVVVLPAFLASAMLGLLFDWLPHHPHADQGRYVDTRAIPSKLLEVLLLGQNLHLVHHLWPSVPFYRYGAVFEASRHALADKGADVGGPPEPGALRPARG